MTNSFTQPWNDACEHWLLTSNLDELLTENQENQENREEEMRLADTALNGFISTITLLGAIEIGLFEALESNPCQLEQLAEQLNVPKTNLSRLLLTLERINLVESTQDGWTLTVPTRRFFTPTAAEFEPYLWTRLPMTGLFLQKYVTQWADMLRGQRQFDELQWPSSKEQKSRDLEYINTAEAPYIAARLKDIIQPAKQLLDVGGGNGTVAALLARQQSDLSVDVLNLPHVAKLITETAEKFDVAERVRAYSMDFLEEPFPTNYDTVMFSQLLTNWPDEVVGKLLSKAHHALNIDGRLIIYERMGSLVEGVSRTWLNFMAIGVNARVFGRTPLRWVDLLDKAGFNNMRLQSEVTFDGYGIIQAFVNSELDETEESLCPSQTVYHNGNTVRVTLSPKEHVQYVGMRMPNGKFFVLNKLNVLIPFNGKNIPSWQGGEVMLEQAVLPNIPRGKYLLYWLSAPEGLDPMADSEQWRLNVSGFWVK